MTRRIDPWLLALVGTLAAALTWAFFAFRYLPMVDLPQHAAQLSAWVHLDDPAYGFADQFELNWWTPYLLSYVFARPFVVLLGVLGALKLVVLLSVLGTMAMYWLLLRCVKQDEWLCLLGLPLSFGFSFYFGFTNFLLGTPLILATAVLALRYSEQPTIRRGIPFALLLGATFLAHVIAFAISSAVAFLLTARRVSSVRGVLRDYWPLLGGLACVVPWIPGFAKSPDISAHPEQWQLSWQRVLTLPSTLFAVSSADELATILGVAVLILVALSLGKPSRSIARYGLLLLALLAYFLFPFELRGVSFLFPRFAALVVPGMILLAAGARPLLPTWLRRPAMVLFAGYWLSTFVLRLRDFNQEAGDFAGVIQELPPRLRVRPMIFANQAAAFPGTPLFLHFPAYYQAEKGGFLGYSFARYYTCFVRYKPGVDIGMGEDQEWNPHSFDPSTEVVKYDYFIARAGGDEARRLFRGSPQQVVLEKHSHPWWIYRAEE
ncbi:MAG: hypothetical protein RL033_7337 [Pseudomonadota bacterium]|jgi:hypothetical protein